MHYLGYNWPLSIFKILNCAGQSFCSIYHVCEPAASFSSCMSYCVQGFLLSFIKI